MGTKSISFSDVPEKYREMARSALKDHVASEHIVTNDITSIAITQPVIDVLNFYSGDTLDENDYDHLRNWTFVDAPMSDPKFSLSCFYGFADWARSRGFEVPQRADGSTGDDSVVKMRSSARPSFKPEECAKAIKSFFAGLRDMNAWTDPELEDLALVEQAFLGVAARAPQYLTPQALSEISEYLSTHPEDIEALLYDNNTSETESLMLLGIDGVISQIPEAQDKLYASLNETLTESLMQPIDEAFKSQGSQSGILFFNLYGVWAFWDKGLQDYL